MQKPECTSVLHYSMFCAFCSVFCPALNLFLFLIVYPYVTLDEEYIYIYIYIFSKNCLWHFFPWHIHDKDITTKTLFSWIQFSSAHTTFLHIMTKRWLKWLQLGFQLLALTSQWTYRLTWQHRGCMFLRLGTWSVYLSVVKLYH
jgi:hypothetical protein